LLVDTCSDKELEKRRRAGFRLLHAGLKQRQVAQKLGVAQQSVHLWAKKLRDEGEAGWKSCRRGPKSRLTTEQLTSIARMISEGPCALGYSVDYWTVSQLRDEIERRYGASYKRCRIIALLHDAGYSARRREGKWRPVAEAKAAGTRR